MKKLARTFAFVVLGSLAAPALVAAQPAPLEMPAASPKARAEQRVGVTDFSIDYSSPGVKGRKIWGDLVPYDKAWRAGANASTTLKVSRDFKLGKEAVKAGSYAVFMIPGKESWTIVLNSDTAAGGTHDPKKDVVRTTVTAAKLAEPRERLTYIFTGATDDQVSLDLEWETVRVRVPLSVDTKAHMQAGIDAALGGAWRPHFLSADYYFGIGDVKRAQPLVQKSISIKPTYRNEWLNAQILAKMGKKADAKAAANRALKLGAAAPDPGFTSFWKGEITKTSASWK